MIYIYLELNIIFLFQTKKHFGIKYIWLSKSEISNDNPNIFFYDQDRLQMN